MDTAKSIPWSFTRVFNVLWDSKWFGTYPCGYCTHFSSSQTNTTWNGSSLPETQAPVKGLKLATKRNSEHLNPSVWGRKEKYLIRFSARFKLLCVIQHQGYYLHEFTNAAEKWRKGYAAFTVHTSTGWTGFFCTTPAHSNTCTSKQISPFQVCSLPPSFQKSQGQCLTVSKTVTISKPCIQKCTVLNLLPWFSLTAVHLLHHFRTGLKMISDLGFYIGCRIKIKIITI